MKLYQIAEALGGEIIGNSSLEVDRPVHPAEAESARDIAIAMDQDLLALLVDSRARAAIVTNGAKVPEGVVDGYVTVGRSRFAIAGITKIFDKPIHYTLGIHPSAVVAPDADLADDDISIGALAFIGPGAIIRRGTIIMPQATIGADAIIGENCLIHPGVRIGERVILGDRVIVHQNASIGADGFSFVTPEPGSVETAKATGRVEATNTEIIRINSIGTVILEDDTEIGACTSIDRGTISATRIGRGTKLDDLVMIGHNVIIGENCMICGQVGIAGSTVVGDRVVLAGQVGVADHLTIGSDVVVGGGSGVGSNLSDREVYIGLPAMKKKEYISQLMMVRRLKTMFSDLSELKKKLHSIES
ncbi:MAG: UDP-3-O-acylglucosamine N-acyltransferase [Alphaproteobacteria bacterium MarineAlpha4_Bin2]|nr:MAG: UDP-3-O-acylglucosamine N-acyltransferase [Alphaproteobacteria bacterium MarineAlpha4_Bin2]